MPASCPPSASRASPDKEQATLERWIKYDVFRIDPANPDPGRVTVRRLNRVEYRNTVQDLLGVDYNTDHEFPPDDSGFGFDNIGDALTVSPMLMEKYVAAAQAVIAQAVPTQPRKPAQNIVPGVNFNGTNARSKWERRQLLFSEPANVAAKYRNELPGTYRVTLELEVNGSYTPDPGRARVISRVDGKEFLNREFGYFDEKIFTFETTQKWTPGEHTFSVELEPTAPGGGDKKTIIDLFVKNVAVEGPLEKEHWVATKNYDRSSRVPTQRSQGAACLCHGVADRVRREGLSPSIARRGHRRAPGGAGRGHVHAEGKTFEQGVAHAMSAVLASPRFLFRLEAPASNALNARFADVDEYSLASRLSYFLWSTMPDAELMDLASRGQLRANLDAQVKRMLADPRADNLARNFTGQWVQARDVEGIASNPRDIILRDAGEEAVLAELFAAW